ncbi:hypothetical protein BEP19_07425 [Ammoniphilus oxalaticus]|uniref:Uncharacterized protein n=1 Tax=Ammoniphilus oxalaticus TaxID=66863 RepID=A0A419SJR7_9BACL|nr:hypothetical protein [Ammoniphilus oxalaticus]RKD24227.1 hypothetical protein BEP19_07425 [Ammoniphilus oxalaticus]
MDKDQLEQKRFLKEQVEWCKKQDAVLKKIEEKLYKMRVIAESALDQELTPLEVSQLNTQLNTLRREVQFLERQLRSDLH